MKKIVSMILSTTILMLIAVSPVSAELKVGYKDYDNGHKYEYKYEDIGDFRYIYEEKSTFVEVLYKKASSKQEIKRIEFPAEHKGKQVNEIGFTDYYYDPTANNLKVGTVYIPKNIKYFLISCVESPEADEPDRLISLKNIEVDNENPYLCSKDGVLYSKDMKTLCLYPNRNSMTVYKMPNSVEDYTGSPLLAQRNNLKKLYLSENLKRIGYYFAAKCKNLEYVYIGTNTEMIDSGCYGAFEGDKKLKTVKINSKKLKNIGDLSFSGCSNLKKINIPSTVKIIGEGAFWQCKSLKKITLPKNLKSIGFSAFADCKKLSKVIINNKKKAPKISKDVVNSETGVYKDAFENTKKGIKFYVKNKKVAKSLKKQLKGSGVRNAKILMGKKVVYKNVK